MNIRNLKKKLVTLGLIGAMTVGCLSGCGSAGGSEKASSGPKKNADGLTEVTFISPTPLESFDYLSMYVGIKMGYFKDEGLEVKMVEQTGTDDMKMLASGQADFGYPSPGVMFSCIDSGITNVKAVLNYDVVQIFGIAVNKKSGIKDIKDLKGKKIALASDSWSSLMAPILTDGGLSADDVEYVNYGDGRFEAVGSNEVPALATWYAEYSQLVGQGYDLDYINGNDYAPQVSNALCTSDDMIKNHPEIVTKFINAFTKASYFCYLNPEAAADITLRQCPNLDIDWAGAVGAAKGDVCQFFGYTEDDQKSYISNGIGKFDMQMCQNAADNLYSSGAIKSKYKAEDYYTNDFAKDYDWTEDDVKKDAEAYTCTSKQYKAAN